MTNPYSPVAQPCFAGEVVKKHVMSAQAGIKPTAPSLSFLPHLDGTTPPDVIRAKAGILCGRGDKVENGVSVWMIRGGPAQNQARLLRLS